VKLHLILSGTALTLALVGCTPVEESADPGGGSVEIPASEPAAPSAPAAPDGLADGSFTSEPPMLKDDGIGGFGGTARVTNTADKELTATFTYTIFKADAQVGSAIGVANAVGAGQTATVQLSSQDPFVEGPYRVEFQVDAEF
jgi:hypothetical protein